MHAWLRAALVYAVGIGLIVFGIVGLVLPLHPGLIVIALGVGVLSLESETARRARQRFVEWLADRDVDSERLDRWLSRVDEHATETEEDDGETVDGEGSERS